MIFQPLAGNACTEDSLSHSHDNDMSVGLLKTDCEDMSMVSFDSMQRANSTLEDFVRNNLLPTQYLPFTDYRNLTER